MTTLRGLTMAGDLVINPTEIIGPGIAILGQSGFGKSTTVRKFCEQLLSCPLPFSIMDIEDEYFSLKQIHPGLIIAGSLGNDIVQLDVRIENEAQVYKLAKRAYIERRSVVLLLGELDEETRDDYVAAYARGLFDSGHNVSTRFPHFFVIEECLDTETEILTPNGFKKYNEVKAGDSAIAFNLETQKYQAETIQRVIVKPYTGKMIRLQTDGGIDSVTTPGHRVVLQRYQHNPKRYKIYDPEVCKAEDLPLSFSVPIGGSPVGPGLDIPDDMLRLIGWVATDGSFHTRDKYLTISQSVSTTKLGKSMVEELRTLLARCNVTKSCARVARIVAPVAKNKKPSFASESYNFYLGAQLSHKILQWTGSEIHRIPRIVLNECSAAQLSILYEALLFGDGTSKSGGWDKFYPGDSEGLADDFQEIALKLGISTLKKFNKATAPFKDTWHVSIASQRSRHWIFSKNKSEIDYDGDVWCVTVPSGAFVARRNGKVFVTGNCQEYVPQVGADKKNPCFRVLKRTAKRGRKRGIFPVWSSQRSADVDKNVLTQCQTFFLHAVTWSNDVTTYGTLLPSTVNLEGQLAGMKPGDVFFRQGRNVVRTRIAPPLTKSPSVTPGADSVVDPSLHYERAEDADILQQDVDTATAEDGGVSTIPTAELRQLQSQVPILEYQLSTAREETLHLTAQLNELLEANKGGRDLVTELAKLRTNFEALKKDRDRIATDVMPLTLLKQQLKEEIKNGNNLSRHAAGRRSSGG